MSYKKNMRNNFQHNLHLIVYYRHKIIISNPRDKEVPAGGGTSTRGGRGAFLSQL